MISLRVKGFSKVRAGWLTLAFAMVATQAAAFDLTGTWEGEVDPLDRLYRELGVAS